MKISELIEILEEYKEKEGDIDICVDDGYILSEGVSIRIIIEYNDNKILVIR